MNNKGRYEQFERYPKYKENYIKAFDRMLKERTVKSGWQNGEEVFRWWMGEDYNQIRFTDIWEDLQELQEDYS
jgi:hypothetical protein